MKLLVLVCIIWCIAFAKAQLRQIGGIDVSVSQYPFVAAIAFLRQLAGNGAIISPKWILTSASAVNLLPDSEYLVGLGTDDFYGEATWYKLSGIFRHPEYVGWDYNVAMMQIGGEIEFNELIQPIDIASSLPETIDVVMLSYGQNDQNTTHLQSAKYKLISDNELCAGRLQEQISKEVIWQHHGFCLTPSPVMVKGESNSDLGAPLVADDGKLYGVFAYAEFNGGTNEGAIAMRIISVAGWIQATMFKYN